MARSVANGSYDIGIMLDGVGIGSTMAANKVPGVLCANCWDDFTANNAREHNHANMLCIGAQVVGDSLAKAIVKKFIKTKKNPVKFFKLVCVPTRALWEIDTQISNKLYF